MQKREYKINREYKNKKENKKVIKKNQGDAPVYLE